LRFVVFKEYFSLTQRDDYGLTVAKRKIFLNIYREYFSNFLEIIQPLILNLKIYHISHFLNKSLSMSEILRLTTFGRKKNSTAQLSGREHQLTPKVSVLPKNFKKYLKPRIINIKLNV